MIAEEKKATEGLEMLWMETENLKREAVGAKQAGYPLVPASRTPDPEVADRATRRRFSAEYKLRILKQADACTDPGSLGALLRREGLYASNLTTWRRQREQGVLSALAPKKRGRKETVRNPLIEENEKLRKDNERLRERLRRAEIIMDVQKKVSQMLGAPLEGTDEGGND
jgi:transposase